MLVRLHSQATTTPKVRADIQASEDPAWVLAARHGTTEQTVYKWRRRDSVEDRSHTPHRLQTTLTPAQEAVAVALRRTLLVSLDDLLAVVREFLNPNVSRSGLDRCLRRHGVGNLRDLQAKEARPKHSAFKAYEPGYIHIDLKYLPQMADESRRRYLFVAIDRATRWVFIRIFNAKTAANARRFLRDLERACPMRIRTILTDNGKEFTDRLFGLRKRAATGEHEFDTLCVALGIEHRLTPPKSPQTNGMVERFNGRCQRRSESAAVFRSKSAAWAQARRPPIYRGPSCLTSVSMLRRLAGLQWGARPWHGVTGAWSERGGSCRRSFRGYGRGE